MNIISEKDDRTSRLKIEGEMTIYSAAELKKGLLDGISGSEAVELDLAEVNEIDTAGFQLLLLAKREAILNGKAFRIVGHSHTTRSVIELFNMKEYLG